MAVRVSLVAHAVWRVGHDKVGLLFVHQSLHALWIGSIAAHETVTSELVHLTELADWFSRKGSVEVVLFGLAESGEDGLEFRSFPEVDVVLREVDAVFVLSQEFPEVLLHPLSVLLVVENHQLEGFCVVLRGSVLYRGLLESESFHGLEHMVASEDGLVVATVNQKCTKLTPSGYLSFQFLCLVLRYGSGVLGVWD